MLKSSRKILILICVVISVSILSFILYKNRHVLHLDSNKPTIKVGIINFWDETDLAPTKNPFLIVNVLTEILNEKFNVQVVKSGYDLLLSGFMDRTKVPIDPKIIKIYYTTEVYLGDIKQRIHDHDLVMGFDFIDAPNYIRLPFSYDRYGADIRHDYVRNYKCAPKDKKYFACFVTRNGSYNGHPGYTGYHFDGVAARVHLFHKLSLYKFVASGGGYLNNMGGPIPYGRENTHNWLSQCKFTIAYENDISYPGNITEKPFQAWFSGSIPIYNTHPQGMEDINKDSVIYARDFLDEDALVEYIKKVDNDDDLYCKIWNQPIVNNPEKDYEVLKEKVREKLDEILEKKLRKN